MPSRRRPRRRGLYAAVAAAVILAAVVGLYALSRQAQPESKPVILYVDEGNRPAVNEPNFGAFLSFASSKGFNTVFLQVYREGDLLFDSEQLSYFVNESHAAHESIFFALYITAPSQALPTAIYGLGENGISLDMSSLDTASQALFLGNLQAGYSQGETAVTTTNMTSALHPDILILETYGTSLQSYVRPGVVGSVGVFTDTSEQEYQSQFQYALAHSDGVMVFDYAGLLKSGY